MSDDILKVQYSYANGSTNTIRPTTLTYPNGRAITIGYGTSGGINDSASRVDALIDGATTLVNYAYLGLGTTVQTTYPQPSLQYTLLGSSGGTSPAGDIYWGLDQFGRIIDSRWEGKRGQVSLFWRRTLLDFRDGTHETHLSGRGSVPRSESSSGSAHDV